MTERRNISAEKLLYILPKYLYSLEKDSNVDEVDRAKIKQLKTMLRSEYSLPTDLL
jgi:4-alpha-glucanotransferase